MACFLIDDNTANNFRGAVRERYGVKAWGKIKEELKIALDNRASILKNGE